MLMFSCTSFLPGLGGVPANADQRGLLGGHGGRQVVLAGLHQVAGVRWGQPFQSAPGNSKCDPRLDWIKSFVKVTSLPFLGAVLPFTANVMNVWICLFWGFFLPTNLSDEFLSKLSIHISKISLQFLDFCRTLHTPGFLLQKVFRKSFCCTTFWLLS